MKKGWEFFRDSFRKPGKNYLFVILYDILFYLGIYLSLILLKTTLESLNISTAEPESLEYLKDAAASNVLTQLTFYFILFIIIIILIYTLFKGLIYCKTLNKKFSLKYYYKFILLNLIWLTSCILISYALLRLLPNFYFFLLLLILWAYFTLILYIDFTEKLKIKSAIESLYKIGIMNFHKIITPYLYALAVFIIIALVSMLFIFIPDLLSSILSSILLLLFMAWLRFYLADAIKKIQ